MKFRLKPLAEQVIVLTGATSGIGLVTARMAARFVAKMVVSARNERALQHLVAEITEAGGQAVSAAADVASEEAVRRIADVALQNFGTIDTWINDAGVSIYGRIEDVPLADMRRLVETNFWGVVNGSRVAVEHFRQRKDGTGAALINIGSTLSDRAIPLQGIYCASKHAVKAFTDALRMELEEEGAPVSVTLIKPAAIDTPYRHHAKNYLNVEPQNPPPVYAPEVVADAILHCARYQVRDLLVGGGAKMISSLGQNLPRFMDKVMEATMFKAQRGDKPPRRTDSLYAPGDDDLQERGGYEGHVMESSLYTRAARNPVTTGAMLVGAAGLAIAALWRRGK
jgi:short-subunit dehydrogenase